MMIKLFFGNRSLILIAIPGLVLLFETLYYFFGTPTTVHTSFGFWGDHHLSPLFSVILSGFFISMTAIFINFIFNFNDFMDRNNFMPSILFVTSASFFQSFYEFNGITISIFFIALMIHQLLRLNQNEDGRAILFNAYLFFGIATTLTPNLLVCLPLVLLIGYAIKPITFKELILSILAIFTPYMYVFFVNDNQFPDVFSYLFNELHPSISNFDLSIIVVINVLFTLLTVQNTTRQGVSRGIRLQKLYRLITFLILHLIGVLFFAISFNGQNDVGIFIAIPVAMITPYAFGMKSLNKFPVFILYLTLLLSVTKFFIPFNSISALL